MGNTPFLYQWKKNDSLLAQELGWATTTEFSIPNVQPSDAGWYFLEVVDAFGRVWTSETATLVVLTPPTIVAQPQSQTVSAGADASLAVVISGAEPLSYQWRKDETSLLDDGRIFGAASEELTISDVFPNDAGGYSVVVSNALGSVTGDRAELVVVLPPIPPSSVELHAGTFTFNMPTQLGVTYVVEYKNTLGEPVWQVLQVFVGDGAGQNVSDLTGQDSSQFYRVGVY